MLNNLPLRLAARIMEREPDVVIGEDYLLRWHVLPRNRLCNLYLHCFVGSDGPDFHDHPWPSLSYCVAGRMREFEPGVTDERGVPGRKVEGGQWRARRPSSLHRLELRSLAAITFFATGPRVRRWGFVDSAKLARGVYDWTHWRAYDVNKRRA